MNDLTKKTKYPVKVRLSDTHEIQFRKLSALYQQKIFLRLVKIGLPTLAQTIIKMLDSASSKEELGSMIDKDVSDLVKNIDGKDIYDKLTDLFEKLTDEEFEVLKNALFAEATVIYQGKGRFKDSGKKEPVEKLDISDDYGFEKAFGGDNFVYMFKALWEACKVYIIPLLKGVLGRQG